jgi:hypothetical protein
MVILHLYSYHTQLHGYTHYRDTFQLIIKKRNTVYVILPTKYMIFIDMHAVFLFLISQ